MEVKISGVTLKVKTIKGMPTTHAVPGRFKMSPEWDKGTFEEEAREAVIFGDPKSKRIRQGKNCAVWWNAEKEIYRVCLTIQETPKSVQEAEWHAEECINFIKRLIKNKN